MSPTTLFEDLCDRLQALLDRSRFVLIALPLFCLAQVFAPSVADPDLFARLAMGRLIETTGSVPLHDPFSFTEKLPLWIDHEWLSGVVFWWLAARWGDIGLIFLKIATVTLTAFFVALAARLHTSYARVSFLFLLLWMASALFGWGSTVRCQVFTYLFIAYQYFALLSLRYTQRVRYVALIPVLSIALVNLHGGYALALITLWLWTALTILEGRPWKTLVVVSILSTGAIFCTPYGAGTFTTYLVSALTMERPSITEWEPIWSSPITCISTIILMIPVIVGILLTGSYRKHILPIGLLIFSAYLGARHVRLGVHTGITYAIFGVGFFRVFMESLHRLAPCRMSRIERSLVCVGALLTAGSVVTLVRDISRPDSFRVDLSAFPVQATTWLRDQKISGRLLVDFNTGSFALWRLYPYFQISMDGRYEEVYTKDTGRLNAEAFTFGSPEGRSALATIHPTHILLQVRSTTFEVPSSLAGSWSLLYKDPHWAVLGTTTPPDNRQQTYFNDGSQPRKDSVPDLWKPLF